MTAPPLPARHAGHVLVKVAALHDAVRDFRELGFTVDYATAPEKAHNAHVWFASGPFLELFELPAQAARLRPLIALRYGSAMADRVARWARTDTEGFCDLAIETDTTDLRADLRALNRAGGRLGRRIRSSRVRPDGERVRYEFAMAGPSRAPFVVSAYDPPQRPPSTAHPNGAHAVTGITLGVAAEEAAVTDAIVGPGDHLLLRKPAARTGVMSITVGGLDRAPDPALLHGAVVVPG